MRLAYDTSVSATSISGQPEAPAQSDQGPSVLGAAFRQENPVVNAIQWMTRPKFQPDPNFDFAARVKETPMVQIKPEAFFGVQSDAEFDSVLARVTQEYQDRQKLQSAGLAGMAAAMGAGLLTPTILLPAGDVMRAKSALQAAGSVGTWAVVGAGLDEMTLQANQELRTPGETAMALGSAAVMGAALGGIVGHARTRAVAKFEQDMANDFSADAIQPTTHPSPVGLSAEQTAAENLVEPSAGGIKSVFGKITLPNGKEINLDAPLNKLSPVTRNLAQPFSDTLRKFQAKLSTGGLILDLNEEGVASAVGGEIEQLAKQHWAKYYRAKITEGQLWKEYLMSIGDSKFRRIVGQGKGLSRQAFDEEVGKALERGGEHEIPQVAAIAKAYRDEVYLPLFQEAKKLGMPGFTDIPDAEAMKYFPRVLRQGLVKRDFEDFRQILKEHFTEVLTNKYSNQFEKLKESLAQSEQNLADLKLTPAETAAKQKELETQMYNLPNQFEPEVADVASRIRELRASAKATSGEQAKLLREEAKNLEKQHEEILKPFKKAERGIRGRFRSLTYTKAGLDARRQIIMDKIDKIESDQLNTLGRLINRVDKVYKDMAKVSPEKFHGEIKRLRGKLEEALNIYTNGEERLAKMSELPEGYSELVFSDVRPTEKISKLQALQDARKAKAQKLLDQLDFVEKADPEEGRAVFEGMIHDLKQEAADINNRRAFRLKKLYDQANELTPEANIKAVQNLENKIKNKRLNFLERLQYAGGEISGKTDTTGAGFLVDGSDLMKATSFETEAQRLAEEISNKMIGEGNRIPALTLLGERGPELTRTLNIDPTRVWSNGLTYEHFLERDIEKVTRRYVRTMGPDLELYRAYGTVNPLKADSGIMQQIAKEFETARQGVMNDPKLSEKQRGKRLEQIAAFKQQMALDLDAEIARLRHTRGVPDNPYSISYRSGKAARNLNTLRMMGTVTLSSIPDLARLTMKSSLTTTFKHAFVPMIRDFQHFKMSAAEARYAGTALDLALHGRAAAWFDIMDELEYGTKFERGLQWSTNNFGKYVAFFDQWNVGMKSLAAATGNARLMMSIEKLMKGKAAKKDITFLAAHGIDENQARIIWEQMGKPGGSDLVNGAYLPNTEAWGKDALRRMNEAPDAKARAQAGVEYDRAMEAVRSYRAALARHIDTTIVTPGLERPLWMDKNLGWQLLAQFRAFTFSSTQQVAMAAIQDARVGNMAPVAIGAIQALALGALSYYTWAISKGGKAKQEMLNSIERGDWGKWADEAIDRSGLLGVLGELRYDAGRVPWAKNVAYPFTHHPSTKSGYTPDLLQVLGPTYSGASDVAQITANLNNISNRNVGQARRLTPYQNVFYLNWLFSALQKHAQETLK